MSSKQFEIDIAFGVLIRVRYTATQGKVDHFTAQLELYDDTGETPVWLPVVRYDSAHGEAHIDYLTPQGVTYKKQWLALRWPYNSALDVAINELRRDSAAHIIRFRTMQEEVR
ncbi:MAG TPA: hypothetical protein VNZ55_03355 [Thermomicrobiales bacterium]|nr:hypothetical protein [Thermomicrobiales bacterium]